MRPKRRLGKSLEDISHLFLSAAPSAATEGTANRRPSAAEGVRIWMVLSFVPELPSAFFAGNIAAELARDGRRVLMIETAPLPSMDHVLGKATLCPSLKDFLEQSHKQVTIEAAAGMKLLGFRLCLEELQDYSLEERIILLQVLRREEESADVVVVHAVYEESPAFRQVLKAAQGAILTVPLQASTMLETYQVCKHLYHLRPDLRVGLVGFGSSDPFQESVWKEKLVRALDQFLGKRLDWYGTIPEDPLIERSLAVKAPITQLDRTSASGASIMKIARHLQDAAEIGPRRSEPVRFFFEGLQTTIEEVRR